MCSSASDDSDSVVGVVCVRGVVGIAVGRFGCVGRVCGGGEYSERGIVLHQEVTGGCIFDCIADGLSSGIAFVEQVTGLNDIV